MTTRPEVNWTLVRDIAILAALCQIITGAFYLIGPVGGIYVALEWALAPVWIFGPVMLVVAVLSKWWRP